LRGGSNSTPLPTRGRLLTHDSTMRTKTVDRYYDSLRNIPPSGGGGCHRALLGIANLGHRSGLDRDQVTRDITAHVHGTRKVSRKEIEEAVSKAFCWPVTHVRNANVRPVVNGEKLFKAIVERGAPFAEEDLWESSPVKIDWPPERDATEVLQRLYRPEERLFIGARHDAGVRQVLLVSEWITHFERGIPIAEHIIPNPLTGERGQTKTGKPSYRADSCVERFRFAVIEFDAMPREQQIQFWAGVPLPVVALVDSGGKSVHAWVKIDAANTNAWTRRVEDKLFTLLTAVGADAACKNEARLSRMPGHFRAEKKRWQRLLYLNPAGGSLIP
jgi:hypothetical protein